MLSIHLAYNYFNFASSEMGTFHLGDEMKWRKVQVTTKSKAGHGTETKTIGIGDKKGLPNGNTQRGTPLTAEEKDAVKKCMVVAEPKIWSDHHLQNTVNCGRICMTQTSNWTDGGKKLVLGKKRQYKGHGIPFFVMDGAEERFVQITSKHKKTF